MSQSKRDQFATLLASVGHAVSRIQRDQVCCGELTFQQFETLRRIERDETDTVTAIASALSIDDSTASRNIKVLVRDGYLRRVRDQEDGRSFRLVLSAKGRTALSNLACDERDLFSAVFDRMSPREQTASLSALAALTSALAGEEPTCCPPVEPQRAASGRPARSSWRWHDG
jgi:DNA-binding MarR family transcriptional regulator